ncbi:MAG: N-acetyl-gamma-glutamyl-phosphate reductase [Burkholderiales bacterium]
MIRVGIVGGTGYTGVELLRLLGRHPQVELKTITSRGEAGTPVSALFPNLRHSVELRFEDPKSAPLLDCDLVFFAAPNGVAMQHVPRLLDAGVRVIDLAADFRLHDARQWEKWYGVPHACPDLLKEAVYGLPETQRSAIRNARLVANPGCYPTAINLGFLPLVEAGLADPGYLIADAKSGVSGAGRSAELHTLFCEVTDSLKAYGVPGHRHLPEIEQELSVIAARPLNLTFVPHLAPMSRGIHATLYARLTRDADLQALYEQRYAAERFVDVLPAGSHPETRSVRASNFCRIAVHRPGGADTAVVLVVIDNLVKGAAGQAVQNMNIMYAIDEATGLEQGAVMP